MSSIITQSGTLEALNFMPTSESPSKTLKVTFKSSSSEMVILEGKLLNTGASSKVSTTTSKEA